MARRRFIQDPKTLEMVEVPLDYRSDGRPFNGDAALWGDRSYDGLRATDGSDIGSRSKHREYMRQHNLTTVDDYHGEWRNAEAKRIANREAVNDPNRRHQIARTIETLQRKRR